MISALSLFELAYKIDDTEPDRAIELYKRAIRIDPTFDAAMSNLGRIYFKRGWWGAAQTWFERAHEANPEQADANYNLGVIHLEHKRYFLALTYLEDAVRIEPAFANAHFNLAEVLTKLGHPQDARKYYRRHIQLRGAYRAQAIAALGLRVLG